MENKQKRKIISLIYKTISLISFIALGINLYLCLDSILYPTETSIVWLSSVLFAYSALLIIVVFADTVSTKKMSNKYKIAKFLYLLIVTSFIGLVVVCVYGYSIKINFSSYISYLLPIALLIATELMMIVNFILGMLLVKHHGSTTVSIDSVSEIPNFDDEVLMKKKLDELNRKLEMKKIQEKIESIEKQLDE